VPPASAPPAYPPSAPSEAPSYSAPSYSAPTYSAPTYQPAYQAPVNPGVPGYGQPTYVIAQPTNSMALAAMITALAGLVTCIAFPIGAILGHVALKQVRQTGEQGEGYAKAGIIVGWIGTGLMILGCGAYLLFFAAIFSSAATYSSALDVLAALTF